jgi:hypothetical protein
MRAPARAEIARAEVVVVLDISDLSRLGDLATAVRERQAPVVCIDHHVSPARFQRDPGWSPRGDRDGRARIRSRDHARLAALR